MNKEEFKKHIVNLLCLKENIEVNDKGNNTKEFLDTLNFAIEKLEMILDYNEKKHTINDYEKLIDKGFNIPKTEQEETKDLSDEFYEDIFGHKKTNKKEVELTWSCRNCERVVEETLYDIETMITPLFCGCAVNMWMDFSIKR